MFLLPLAFSKSNPIITLAEILKDSDYKLTRFNIAEQQKLEKSIAERTDSKEKPAAYVKCLVRNKVKSDEIKKATHIG